MYPIELHTAQCIKKDIDLMLINVENLHKKSLNFKSPFPLYCVLTNRQS